MDTISGAALARELGTSTPRVTRAVTRLGIEARQPNGRLALTRRQANRVRRELGVTPRIEGLTRSQSLVLAALRSAPLGLVSIRAVARRGGLSPTAAGTALQALLGVGLVTRSEQTIAAGRARTATVWCLAISSPRLADLDPDLSRVELRARPRRADKRVPPRLRHLFWNTADSQLDTRRAGDYIARRLLRTMDLQGLAWGASALRASDWERGAVARGLSPKVKRLARNLADASR